MEKMTSAQSKAEKMNADEQIEKHSDTEVHHSMMEIYGVPLSKLSERTQFEKCLKWFVQYDEMRIKLQQNNGKRRCDMCSLHLKLSKEPEENFLKLRENFRCFKEKLAGEAVKLHTNEKITSLKSGRFGANSQSSLNCVSRINDETEHYEKEFRYSIIIGAISNCRMKSPLELNRIFSTFVQLRNLEIKKSEFKSKKSKVRYIHLFVSENPEKCFGRLRHNLMALEDILGVRDLTILLHVEENIGLSEIPWEKRKLRFYPNLNAFTNAVDDLIKMCDTETSSGNTKEAIHEVEEVLSKMAKHILKDKNLAVKMHIFGSRVTELAVPGTDIDLFLEIGESFQGLDSRIGLNEQKLVMLFGEKMKSDRLNFPSVIPIASARVPIIKFVHKSKLNFDLSFRSGLATRNSVLIRTYLKLDERVKFLVCAVKLWMFRNEFADPLKFTSYAQVWMVLFFLMQADNAVVPTLTELRNSLLPADQQTPHCDGWNCSFPSIEDIVWESKCKLTSNELLHRFFTFYSDSSLKNYVLCTLTGQEVEKRCFVKEYDKLPEEFARFKHLMEEDDGLFIRMSRDFKKFCIQDPFNHLSNVTRFVNADIFRKFIKLCKQTAECFDRWKIIEEF